MYNTSDTKTKTTNRELYLLFFDLTKAYDSAPLNTLWESLNESTINTRLMEGIKSLHKGTSSKIKIGNLITKVFKLIKRLKQECSLSPTLYKIHPERVLMNWKRKGQTLGTTIQNIYVYTLNFADGQVLLAQDQDDMEFMARKLNEE